LATNTSSLDELRQCRQQLGAFVAAFEPKCWAGADASKLVRMLVEIERLASAGKTLAAGQVERTNGWRAGGHRSAEAWLAHEEGSSVSSAS